MSGLDSERFEYHTLVGYAFAPQEQTTSIYTTRNSWWYRNFRYKGAVGCNFFLDWMTPGGIDFEYLRKSSVYQSANIIHLHCIQGGYFDWKILPLIAREKKIVMTLHDDWIVSGNDPINLYHPYKTQHQYQKRSTLLRDIPISYIGVSDWITNKLKNDNILGNNSVKTIYNGIDTDTFYTKNRQESRQRLGLPKNKKIIISLAGSGGKTTAK